MLERAFTRRIGRRRLCRDGTGRRIRDDRSRRRRRRHNRRCRRRRVHRGGSSLSHRRFGRAGLGGAGGAARTRSLRHRGGCRRGFHRGRNRGGGLGHLPTLAGQASGLGLADDVGNGTRRAVEFPGNGGERGPRLVALQDSRPSGLRNTTPALRGLRITFGFGVQDITRLPERLMRHAADSQSQAVPPRVQALCGDPGVSACQSEGSARICGLRYGGIVFEMKEKLRRPVKKTGMRRMSWMAG